MIPQIRTDSAEKNTSWTVWFGDASTRERVPLNELRIDTAAKVGGPSLRVFGEEREPHCQVAAVHGCEAVFFGTLWNGEDLVADLAEAADHVTNDAHIVLGAYRKWGSEFLHRIRGVFSVVLCDRRRGALICARDPMGIWPLFYSRVRSGFVFSTSIDGVLRFPGVSRAVSRSSLAILLSNLNQKKDETFYEAIHRLPGGHAIESINGDIRIRRYWDPVPSRLPGPAEGKEELERFESLVEQAVARCLQWGSPGIYLSGGIDSVSVAVTATELRRRHGLPPPKAFSLIFPDQMANEESVQRGVATALGLDHFIVDVEEAAGPGGLLLNALEISRNMSAPTLTLWLPAYHRLSREARERGCECIFTGGGGDEWMGNSPFLVADRMHELDFAAVYQLWNVTRNSFNVPPYRLARALLWVYGARPLLGGIVARILSATAPTMLEAKRRRYRDIPDWISGDPEFRQHIEAHLEPTILASELGGFYLREVRRFLDHSLVAWEMEAIFENHRLTGMPILQPLFDPDLLELLCRVGPELLSAHGRSKSPARQLVARKLPTLGFDKQKKVQGTNYFATVMAREGRSGWESLGGVSALADLGVIDPQKWKLTMDAILRNNQPQELFRLWASLSVEAWVRSRI